MGFLISVIDDQTGTATSTEMKAIDGFNAQLPDVGPLVLTDGRGAPESVHHR